MTIQYQQTPEESSFDQIVDEEWDSLSEAARTVLGTALQAAHKDSMVDSYCYLPQEYEDDMKSMRRAAARLTDHDLELLTKIWRSALAAAASVDPYDFETVVGRRVYAGSLFWYYRTVFSMVQEVEEEKRCAERRKKELAEQERTYIEDLPF